MSPPDSASSPGGDHNGKMKSEVFSEKSSGPPESAVESLGEALAGVNLGPASKTSNFGSSVINSATFALTPASSTGDNDGWGNFAAQAGNRGSDDPSAVDHMRNESIELFLSQSPSQTLGEDVFRFSHTNLPSLAEERHAGDNDGFRMPAAAIAPGPSSQSFGEIRHQETNRRRVESPSCSVTGTTTSSRSVSPYANNSDVSGSRAIHGYQRFETPETNRNTNSLNDGTKPSLENSHKSPYGKERNHVKNVANSYDHGAYDRTNAYSNIDQQHQQHLPMPQMQNSGGQQPMPQHQQVLYMAVPSPDGQGQVLQPVQMMQMPGKPYAYVIPGGSNMQSMVQQDGTQSMPMVLPPPPNQSAAPEYGGLGSPNDIIRNNHRDGYGDENRSGNPYNPDNSYGLPGARNGFASPEDYKNNSLGGGPVPTQYPTDPAIASLYSAQQRPPLDALLGQVRRLSRDQVGCRLVQQALDEEGPMTATLILNEGLQFWGEAMVDPFGNYLFQKIIEKITAEERIMLVKSVSSRLVNASLNLHGTRSVQKVVELCAQDEHDAHANNGNNNGEESAAAILTKALAPAAARLCIDSHGNHVIQRILLRLGPKHSQFVFDAVAASVGDVARHRHGCCVIQRCLDSPQSPARAHLVHRIVEKSLELMQDAYGNYVVQYVLDVCSDEDVHAVCESVVGKVNLLAIQKFSSNVMEKCLERCGDRVKEMYLHEMSDPERIRELMMDPFGNYVVQRALSVATHAQAIRLVEAMRPHLIATQTGGPNGQRNGGVRNTAGGRRIIAKICRRFPNFTLNPMGTHEELYSQNKANHRYLNHHQQGHPVHNIHKQSPMLAAYAPIGAPNHMPPHYGADPRLVQGHMALQHQQPQQSHAMAYGAPLAGNPFYDPFAADSQGGYPGM